MVCSLFYFLLITLTSSSIVIATPTRLDHVITGAPELKAHFRALEMLIVDEADRFADEEFQTRCVQVVLYC